MILRDPQEILQVVLTLIFCAQQTYHYLPLIISNITKINFTIFINYRSLIFESLRDPREMLQVVLVLIFCAQGSTI